MPAKKTRATPAPKTQSPNTMGLWLWKMPLKFTALSVGILVGFFLILALIGFIITLAKGPEAAYDIGFSASLISVPMILLFLAACVFAIYKCVKWLPNTSLDRTGYVAIDTGASIIQIFLFALPFIIGFAGYTGLMAFIVYLGMQNNPLFIVAYAAVILLGLYLIGVIISSTVATFRRGQSMNIPRWKLLASIPFGLSAIFFPGFFLPEAKKPAPALMPKTKWFGAFINWIVARPANAIIVFALSTV
ncbi:MAG: hypothetical protein FWG18_00870, partial [Alphaproteobacteria bacterium]|nr:hypothetical protein [Alphaproteobacteria bacterium]